VNNADLVLHTISNFASINPPYGNQEFFYTYQFISGIDKKREFGLTEVFTFD